MNKSKIILCVIGGVFVIAVGTFGFLAYSAFSSKNAALVEGDEEGNAGLESVIQQIASLSAKDPYPSKANAERISANAQAVSDWITSVRDVAARGDWCPDATCTSAQFKEKIGREAKALLTQTDAKGTPFLKPEFSFGSFRDYLGEKMPAQDKLARLQRQWYDLHLLLTLLATNGVEQVTDLQVIERTTEEDEASASRKSKKAKNRKVASTEKEPSIETYQLTFQALPSVLIQVVRDLSFCPRFTVVDSFAFTRERDAVFAALGGGEKKDAAPRSGGRRAMSSRRTKDAAEEAKDETAKGPVFDPATDSLLKVELTVSVYDFRSLEDDEKGESK